jgi:hypothetical protein
MIRTFVKPTQSNYSITLTLPKDYIGQEIEIIAFKKEEGLVKEKPKPAKIKTKTISKEKALLISEIKEAVENLALAKQGKLKLKSARDLYNEL